MPEAASQTLQEVDNNFIGFNSRLDPSNLEPGFAQASQNVRLQRGTAQPRKGTKRLTQQELNSLTMVGSGNYLNAAGQDNIVLVFTDSMYLFNTETGILSGAKTFPSGRGIVDGGVCDVVQALDKIYIFRGQYDDTVFSSTITNAAISNGATGTITVTTINAHGYSTGDEVTVLHTNANNTSEITVNGSKIITVTGANTFTIQYTNNTGSTFQAHTNSTGWTSQRGKPPLIWDGASTSLTFAEQKYTISGGAFTTVTYSVPCADFGLYFQNRLVVKYANDQIGVGDILSESFDVNLNNFRVNQGGNDKITGFLPWIENQFLVFMAKSIFVCFVETTSYITGSSPGVNSSVTIVTNQVGCLARKSIVPAGQFVFFLSGKGVHMLSPQLDLKLLGNTLPLSEPIDDFFDDVNFAATAKAAAVYYDNRFFISLPTNGSARNNKTLVYNTLNTAWETIDTYPVGMYQDDWQIAQYNGKRRLFLLTRFAGSANYGGIFLTDEYTGGDEYNSLTGNPVIPFTLPAVLETLSGQLVPIDARIRSRQYTFNNLSTKRFSRAEYQFNNSPGDLIQIFSRTHDPDAYENVMTYQFQGSATTDSTLRPRLASRGACVDMEVVFVQGRPALKSAAIFAIVANRNMESEE
jgi:hypothetical protein